MGDREGDMCCLLIFFIVVSLLFFAMHKNNTYIYFYFEKMDIERQATFPGESYGFHPAL